MAATTTKTCYRSATSDEIIPGIREETRPRLLCLLVVGESQGHLYQQLTEKFCSGLVYLKLACVIVLEGDSESSSEWATEATAKVVAEAETCRSWVV